MPAAARLLRGPATGDDEGLAGDGVGHSGVSGPRQLTPVAARSDPEGTTHLAPARRVRARPSAEAEGHVVAHLRAALPALTKPTSPLFAPRWRASQLKKLRGRRGGPLDTDPRRSSARSSRIAAANSYNRLRNPVTTTPSERSLRLLGLQNFRKLNEVLNVPVGSVPIGFKRLVPSADPRGPETSSLGAEDIELV